MLGSLSESRIMGPDVIPGEEGDSPESQPSSRVATRAMPKWCSMQLLLNLNTDGISIVDVPAVSVRHQILDGMSFLACSQFGKWGENIVTAAIVRSDGSHCRDPPIVIQQTLEIPACR